MTIPFFSIIIPVYKADKYLHQCVDSVLSQSYTNYEIILVDDGSPDSCPQICDEYSAKDTRIKTVHRENGGQSCARNAGLSNCSAGKESHYILFIDSDDFWEGTTVLQDLSDNIAEYNSDVILFGCYDLYSDGTKRISRGTFDVDYINSQSKIDVLNYLFKINQFPGAAWVVATRKSIIDEHNMQFVVGNNAEDYAWLIQLFYVANNISAISNVFYNYRYTVVGSITSTPKPAGERGLIYTIKYWQSLRESRQPYKCFDIYMMKIYLMALSLYANLDKTDRRLFRLDLVKYKSVLTTTGRFIDKVLYVVVSLLGVRCTAKLISTLYQLRRK